MCYRKENICKQRMQPCKSLCSNGFVVNTLWERPLMTSHFFLAIFDLPTYLVLLYNVRFWGLYWTPLPTLMSDVINGRSLFNKLSATKGQLISKCLYEIIVWTKIPTKILIVCKLDSLCSGPLRAEIIKFFVGILVQTKTSKRHFEINWPLDRCVT